MAHLLFLCLLAITTYCYLPGLDAGFYFDDETNIVDATALHWHELSLENIIGSLENALLGSRPLANLSFALNHLHSGLVASSFRITNISIHLINGILLYLVILTLGQRHKATYELPQWRMAAVLATAFFLLHPINIQGVTYIVQRMTSLATLFSLLSFLFYLHATSRYSHKARNTLLSIAITSWVLGVLSKEIALALPGVIILYEYAFNSSKWRTHWDSISVNSRWMFIGTSIVTVAASAWFLYKLYPIQNTLSWQTTLPGRDYSGYERMLTEARAIFWYLSLWVWPDPERFSIDHNFNYSLGLIKPVSTILAVFSWLVVIALLIKYLRKVPFIAFPLLSFLLLHAIESGPINLELVFEHRMYLPSTMLSLFIAAVTYRAITQRNRITLGVVIILIPLISIATYMRNTMWGDPIGFHIHTAEHAPQKFRPQYNLGTILGTQGNYTLALHYLERARAIQPEDSFTHNQIGNVYAMLGDRRRSMGSYESAVTHDPDNIVAIFNLAQTQLQLGDTKEAYNNYTDFLRKAPEMMARERQIANNMVRRLHYSVIQKNGIY